MVMVDNQENQAICCQECKQQLQVLRTEIQTIKAFLNLSPALRNSMKIGEERQEKDPSFRD